jgi:subtilisin family serine protease
VVTRTRHEVRVAEEEAVEQTYTVLRDMSRFGTAEPFDAGIEALDVAAALPAPRVDREEMSKREVHDVARAPEVRAIAPVMPICAVEPVADSDSGAAAGDDDAPDGVAWGVSAVGADVSGRSGAGVVVAVLDTGIDVAHPAFQGVNIVQEDFSGDGNGDVKGHGTHCAGTVFGRDVAGTRIGVARGVTEARIGKVLGNDGRGGSDMLFRGMQWAAAQGAHVISMSLGFDFPGMVKRLTTDGWPADLATSRALEAYRANLRMFDALMQLILRQEAFGDGTVVVAASGNESKRTQNPDHEIGVSLPAAAEGILSTGALGRSAAGLVVAPFSNTFPQLAAPGVAVLSAKVGGGLVGLNGTSMATPHAAGVAALWWEELRSGPVPASATTVKAHMLARADTTGLDPAVDPADRGVGLVRSP